MTGTQRAALALVGALALATTGCTKSALVDFAMGSAKVPASHRGYVVGDRRILAGDMHCHVLPPDAPWHVTRHLDETLAIAAAEDLDFVVLTPHVPSRFFTSAPYRAWVRRTQADLRQRLAARVAEADADAPLVIPGFEYTDYAYGHVGAAFADVEDVLAELPPEDARAHPEAFFRLFLEHGGVLTINHPVERPLPHAAFSNLRADLSWRAFRTPDVPDEIAFVHTHAQSVEVFNASITHLRDQYILGDEERSMREAAALVDHASRDQGRRIADVGGSDSHGQWLRPTTYVLARERSIRAIRDAIVGGRTCVRGPEACTLELRAPGGAWRGVGDGVDAPDGVVEARAQGPATYFVNGAPAARAGAGETATFSVPHDRCALVRAVVGMSWSSPVYVGCAFARP